MSKVKKSLARFLKNNKDVLLFVVLMMVFRSAIADWSDVPTGSMKPTIVEGDRILVNKMAYDIRVPFTTVSLHKMSDPQRGDIIIFDSEVSDKRLVKRVIGVPGDRVEMINNVLFINGVQLNYKGVNKNSDSMDVEEDLLGLKHQIRVMDQQGYMASFAAVVVPENSYLALGDNRDQSADSRVIGFVPRSEIVGRSSKVAFSLDYENYFLPRTERFFTEI